MSTFIPTVVNTSCRCDVNDTSATLLSSEVIKLSLSSSQLPQLLIEREVSPVKVYSASLVTIVRLTRRLPWIISSVIDLKWDFCGIYRININIPSRLVGDCWLQRSGLKLRVDHRKIKSKGKLQCGENCPFELVDEVSGRDWCISVRAIYKPAVGNLLLHLQKCLWLFLRTVKWTLSSCHMHVSYIHLILE